MSDYFKHPDRAKENVEGPFYSVDIGCDCGCELPELKAPNLVKMTEDSRHQTYFYKQPTSTGEIDLAIELVNLCPIHDIRYGGKEPEIICRLDATQSDYQLNEKGGVVFNDT